MLISGFGGFAGTGAYAPLLRVERGLLISLQAKQGQSTGLVAFEYREVEVWAIRWAIVDTSGSKNIVVLGLLVETLISFLLVALWLSIAWVGQPWGGLW